jgi:hypothetical protein
MEFLLSEVLSFISIVCVDDGLPHFRLGLRAFSVAQRNMPGTVFYNETVATLFSDLCDTFTISLSFLSWHA